MTRPILFTIRPWMPGVLLISVLTCSAQLSGQSANEPAPEPLDAVIERLTASEGRYAEWAAAEAADGTPMQRILEAGIVLGLQSDDFRHYPEVLAGLEAERDDWTFEGGLVNNPRGLTGLIHAVEARIALDGGDATAFETHVKEAFWHEPQLAGLLQPWMQTFAVRQVSVPMDQPVLALDGEPVTLAELVAGQDALLIDFWASWCGPCMRLMPALKAKAAQLDPQGIRVMGLNTEGLAEARSVYEELDIGFTWMVEPEERPLSRLLQVDSIPRMVLLSPEGAVLFSGHPMDSSLKTALAQIGAALQGEG